MYDSFAQESKWVVEPLERMSGDSLPKPMPHEVVYPDTKQNKFARPLRLPKGINTPKTNKFTIIYLRNFKKYIQDLDPHQPIELLESFYGHFNQMPKLNIKKRARKSSVYSWRGPLPDGTFLTEAVAGLQKSSLLRSKMRGRRIMMIPFTNYAHLDLLYQVENLTELWISLGTNLLD